MTHNPKPPTDAQMKLADFKAEWRKDMSEREIEALAGRMRANPEIKAPCQGYPGGIPWETHMRAYEVYCAKYRGQVALIDLFGRGCRGGFAVDELDAFIPGWRDELSLIATLNARIQATEARAQGLVDALNGYKAAVAFVAADAWDGCSDCIDVLKAARCADTVESLTPDEIAANLKRIRLHFQPPAKHSQHGGERER